MIKIDNSLFIRSNNIQLDNVALDVFNSLCKKNSGNRYHQYSLATKCVNILTEIKSDAYLKKHCKQNKNTQKRHISFIEWLSRNNYYNLQEIITSRPENLLKINNEIKKIIDECDISYKDKSNKTQQTYFCELISKKLFNYTNYRKSKTCKTTYEKLGFRKSTCPYCNDAKVNIIGKDNDTMLLFDLDHFYPKSIYPYFALSFFNLIPTCNTCNSRMKSDKGFCITSHINPYHSSFDNEYEFKVPIKDINDRNVRELKIKHIGKKPNDNTVSDLKLESRYENYKDELTDLIKTFHKNRYRYKQDKIHELKEIFFEHRKIPMEASNILQTQNSKMYRDILIELDTENLLGIK